MAQFIIILSLANFKPFFKSDHFILQLIWVGKKRKSISSFCEGLKSQKRGRWEGKKKGKKKPIW